ncbi:MAG: hypothetical protein K0Q73_9296 [Paenibacillus sp.]|nr:hypothetical protein [Paenibacillus sp.]
MPDFIQLLKVTIASSIPLTFASMLICFSFWGISIKTYFLRIAAFTILHSIIIDILFFTLPAFLRPISLLLTFFVCILLMFPTLSKKIRITLSFSVILSVTLFESCIYFILVQFYSSEVVLNSFLILGASYWPCAALVTVISIRMEINRIQPGVSILAFIKRKRDRKLPALMLFFFTQILLILIVMFYRGYAASGPKLIDITLLLVVAFTLTSLILVLELFTQVKNDAVKETQQFYIDDINRMFTTVRGQRHDFLNHVQVISSFLRMRKLDELDKYTKELIGETTEINDIISIGNPALAALIRAKSTEALSRKIQFEYDCGSMEGFSLGVKSIDLIKILGNLLDNAFEASMLLPANKRIVQLNCVTEVDYLRITVRNHGTYISDEIREKLFIPGFSTKEGDNHGIGLSIVKERTEFYQGTLEVQSSRKDGTCFHIRIPQKNAL